MALLGAADGQPGTWALLISGGVRPRKNYPRYWNNISLVDCTLRALGWQNIRVLYAGGASSEPDRLEHAFLGMFGFGRLIPSPADIDLDGAAGNPGCPRPGRDWTGRSRRSAAG